MRCALVAALVVLALTCSSPASAQLLSPGQLSSDHAEVDGDANCGRCHEGGRRVSRNGCGSCHRDVQQSIRARTGLHGREYRDQDCGQCHVEHRGRRTQLVRWPGGSRERFDHDLTGYLLRGGHREPSCDGCHDNRNSRGHATFLGLSQRCNSCHDDPHSTRFGTRCESCHDDSRWSSVRLEGFDHRRTRYPLVGQHQQVECVECHGEPPRYRDLDVSECSSCHEDPHAGRYGSSCSDCHTEAGWNELGALRRNHPGLSLGGGHQEARCGDCHDQGVSRAPSGGGACVSCHQNTHEADFGRRCESCHGSIQWMGLPRRTGLRAHERTPFPLVGQHVETACGECHDRRQPPDVRYRQLTFDRCTSCHEDPHPSEQLAMTNGDCSGCHTEQGFAPSSFGFAQHEATGFALDGMHAAVSCAGCHSDTRPRLDWRVPEQTCASCHENPHGDQFATEMAQGGCATCHRTAGWDEPNIDHSTWPLDGAHAEVSCNACHSPTAEDRAAGAGASYRGVPRECAGCHEDEHAGQFRLSAPTRQCTVCHTTASFTIAAFDHAAMADYPLVGRHAEAECADCHPSVALRGGDEAVLYRLGYRECRDCHADPHAGGAQ